MSRFWFLAMLLVAACKVGSPGESTPAECDHNGIDEDDDGLYDCDDPGCRALEVCAGESPPVIPPPPPPTMFGDPMSTLPLGDSSVPVMPSLDGGAELDSGEEPVPDAAPMIEDPPPPCQGLCTATQSCIDNECKDVTSPKEATYELRVLSARVPSRGAFGLCLDMDCSFPFDLSCRCPPDPLVRVLRVRQPATEGAEVEVSEIGRTTTVTNDVTPTFPDESYDLQLEPGDALRFEVWDADPELMTAQFVFECRPNLSAVEPGEISCMEAAIGEEGSVLAEIIEKK